MITSSGSVIFESGSIASYASPSIVVVPTLYARSDEVLLLLRVAPGGSPDVSTTEVLMRTTKTLLDAKTGTGTGDTAKYLNAVEQVLKDMLLALNPSVTFTIV